MKVLKVEPYQLPEVKEIDSGLSSLQHEVEGWIEATYPFEDPVAIICNEEGKLNGLSRSERVHGTADGMPDHIISLMNIDHGKRAGDEDRVPDAAGRRGPGGAAARRVREYPPGRAFPAPADLRV